MGGNMLSDTRKAGNYFETYTGIKFYPLDPKPVEICIEDIAHALSNICRYNGHSKFFYSVAQHCVLCHDLAALYFEGNIPLYCLLHDAAEAYICDLPRPVKTEINGYKAIEETLEVIILSAYGLYPVPPYIQHQVKAIDDQVLHMEAEVLLNRTGWAVNPVRQKFEIHQWAPEYAEKAFRDAFNTYTLTEGR
jgi:hypothetical protein